MESKTKIPHLEHFSDIGKAMSQAIASDDARGYANLVEQSGFLARLGDREITDVEALREIGVADPELYLQGVVDLQEQHRIRLTRSLEVRAEQGLPDSQSSAREIDDTDYGLTPQEWREPPQNKSNISFHEYCNQHHLAKGSRLVSSARRVREALELYNITHYSGQGENKRKTGIPLRYLSLKQLWNLRDRVYDESKINPIIPPKKEE